MQKYEVPIYFEKEAMMALQSICSLFVKAAKLRRSWNQVKGSSPPTKLKRGEGELDIKLIADLSWQQLVMDIQGCRNFVAYQPY